jgi:hypothetical protein
MASHNAVGSISHAKLPAPYMYCLRQTHGALRWSKAVAPSNIWLIAELSFHMSFWWGCEYHTPAPLCTAERGGGPAADVARALLRAVACSVARMCIDVTRVVSVV